MEAALFAGLMTLAVVLIFASMVMAQAIDPVQARLQQIAVRPRTLEELEGVRQAHAGGGRRQAMMVNCCRRLFGGSR